jgi:hypothetical protein
MPQNGPFYISDPTKERPYLVDIVVIEHTIYRIEVDAEDASYAEALAENTWNDGHKEEFQVIHTTRDVDEIRIWQSVNKGGKKGTK